MERGQLGAALFYMIGSVVLSISALVGGIYISRLFIDISSLMPGSPLIAASRKRPNENDPSAG
jgi:hypothetical protein